MSSQFPTLEFDEKEIIWNSSLSIITKWNKCKTIYLNLFNSLRSANIYQKRLKHRDFNYLLKKNL